MEKDLISLIVPVYKVEPYLDYCIESIVSQTYKNLEIILVDDGSPDECPQICDKWEKKDNRIIVIHKENRGLSSARNAGIDKSSGKYLAFIDSDDYIDKTMVEKLYMRIKKDRSELALCSVYSVDDESGRVTTLLPKLENMVWNKKDFWNYYYRKGSTPLTVAWNKLYSAKLFEKERYDVGKSNEDVFIIHRLVEKCQRISVLGERLYYYVQRKGSIMQKYSVKRLDAVEALFNRSRYFAKEKDYNYAFMSLGAVPSILSTAYVRLDMKRNPQYQFRYKKLKAEYEVLKRQYWKKNKAGVLYNVKFIIKNIIFKFSEKAYFCIWSKWAGVK